MYYHHIYQLLLILKFTLKSISIYIFIYLYIYIFFFYYIVLDSNLEISKKTLIQREKLVIDLEERRKTDLNIQNKLRNQVCSGKKRLKKKKKRKGCSYEINILIIIIIIIIIVQKNVNNNFFFICVF
jgi:hypothetical protein